MEGNGQTLEFAKDIATLKNEVANLKGTMIDNHKEIIEEFRLLRAKVNEEITTMQKSLDENRQEVKQNRADMLAAVNISKKQILKIMIIAMVFGTFIWVSESRQWILQHIFQIF